MKFSLAKINFLNVLITSLLFTVSVGFLEVYTSYKHFDKQIERMQNRYISVKKTRTDYQVKKLVLRIQEDIVSRYEVIEQTLKDKIDEAIYLYLNVKNNYPELGDKEILKLFVKELDNYKTPYNSGYFYVFDKNMIVRYHGASNDLEGKSLYSLIDGSSELKNVIKRALSNDESSGKYPWKNPKSGQIEKKFAYVKKIAGSKFYIATGYYVDNLEEDIKNSVKKIVLNARFGIENQNYFWIHSKQGELIAHPITPNIGNIYEYKNENGIYPFQEMRAVLKKDGHGFVEYLWKYPGSDEEEKKISYVQNLQFYDWAIGSGFYFREQIGAIQEERDSLEKDLKDSLIQIFLLLGAIFSAAVFVAYSISRKIKEVEDEKITHLNMLEQYKMVLDKSAIVSKTDKNGFISYVNDKFVEICGYTKSEVMGKSHNILRHKSMPKDLFEEMWKKISLGLIWTGIIKNRRKDSSSYYISTTIIPIKDKMGEIIEYISASTDITKLITTSNMLENFTLTDGLTGLGSRVKLTNDLKNSTSNILAIVDILKFTEINDMYGQKVGDKIIQEVAGLIFEFSKINASINTYRLHADVFAVLYDSRNKEIFIPEIKNLIKKLKEHKFDENDVDATFDFAAGISYGNEEVLAYADMALKNAKINHISVGIYNKDNSLLEEYKNNEKWMKIVQKALDDDRIIPYFQPIYSYEHKRINKYESLMRLIDKNGNVITPACFLDVIKYTGLYPKATKAMIRKSIDIFRTIKDASFSITLTLEDLLNAETMQYFYSIASSADIFDRLIIEIVESEELVNFEKVADILSEFKLKGTKIAIDDFGTGYSNYNYLRKLDVDFIKIDGSIIENISDEKTRELISTMYKVILEANQYLYLKFRYTSKC